jgi:hypothetical protein
LTYNYDPRGNIVLITDGANSSQRQDFVYDSLNRLAAAGANGVGNGHDSERYAHDSLGNMTSQNGAAYAYADSAHKHAVTLLSNGNNFVCDAAGNMTSRPIALKPARAAHSNRPASGLWRRVFLNQWLALWWPTRPCKTPPL